VHKSYWIRKTKKKSRTVDDDTLYGRCQVLKTLWKAGIPLWKLEQEEFVDLIQNPQVFLGGRTGVSEQQASLRSLMMEAIRGQLRGRKLCLIPDGSKINLNVEAMIARYLNDDDDPCSLCVAVHKVGKGLDADTMLYMLQQDVNSL
jgi:hypothetical protein